MSSLEDTNPTSTWYGYEGAASALGEALRDLYRLEREQENYHYELPPTLRDDMKNAARRARNAVRYLMSEDAD